MCAFKYIMYVDVKILYVYLFFPYLVSVLFVVLVVTLATFHLRAPPTLDDGPPPVTDTREGDGDYLGLR